MCRIWREMTENHENLLAAFEVRIGDLMSFCNRLKEENAGLKETLEEKTSEIGRLKRMVEELNARYDNLLAARILSVEEGDVKEAQQRLAKLVREVDKCIALLNE